MWTGNVSPITVNLHILHSVFKCCCTQWIFALHIYLIWQHRLYLCTMCTYDPSHRALIQWGNLAFPSLLSHLFTFVSDTRSNSLYTCNVCEWSLVLLTNAILELCEWWQVLSREQRLKYFHVVISPQKGLQYGLGWIFGFKKWLKSKAATTASVSSNGGISVTLMWSHKVHRGRRLWLMDESIN